MKQTFSARPSQRIDRLRWQVPLLAFLLVLTDQIVEHTGLIRLSDWGHFAAQILFYGIIGSLLGWWALASIGRRVRETEAAKTALQTANVALSEAKQRLEFLIHVNHRLSETADEEALRKTILELPFEVVPAVGCSLVQIDDHGQSLPAVHRGFQAQTLYEAWTAHLTSADRGRPCLTCSASWIVDPSLCPHLSLPSKAQMIRRICRLPLARGEREYGQLYIYLADANRPNDREKTLLVATANELAQALESQHLRSRELDVLYRLQRARRMSNLQSELAEVLTHTVDALEVDSGVLFLADAKTAEYHLIAEAGQPLDAALPLVRGLTDGTRRFETPLVISELEPDPKEDSTFRSLLVAPLPGEDRPLGSFVLGARQPDAFTRRHVRLMTMMAGQAALLVENHWLYLEAEDRAALAERARLGREIHDGLAQTLGYLKLRAVQIANWLNMGELEQAGAGLEDLCELLSDVYVDTREAIDGLSVNTSGATLGDWLGQVITDFEGLSHIVVEATAVPALTLPTEVQVQLLRIVQEALSNVRKHSGATRVKLEWQINSHWLILRISDDGQGFDPADVPRMSKHGLHIMRERAELLDADFQIVSRLGAGTQLIIRLLVGEIQGQAGHD